MRNSTNAKGWTIGAAPGKGCFLLFCAGAPAIGLLIDDTERKAIRRVANGHGLATSVHSGTAGTDWEVQRQEYSWGWVLVAEAKGPS